MSISNVQIAERFGVKISNDGIYAIDSKGRSKFVTDLRRQMMAEATKSKKAVSKQAMLTAKIRDNAANMLITLERALPEQKVITRRTQAGIEGPNFQFYTVCGAYRHVASISSTVFTEQDLKQFFGDYTPMENHKNPMGISFGSLTEDQVIDIARRACFYHSSAKDVE